MNSKLEQLADKIQGELHYDSLMRSLYATDASVYRKWPLAVAIPKDEEDIKHIVKFAADHNLSLIPRGAGTSLAGQVVGDGIVIDLSKNFREILELNEKEKWVLVEPGVVRDELNDFLKPYGLFFGPNTSTANRCNLGGMLGNNSCGTTSIVYGSTRDHILETHCILSDASEVVFTSLDSSELENKLNSGSLESEIYKCIYELLLDDKVRNEIKQNFPKATVSRRNTGYALDYLLKGFDANSNNRKLNLSELLAGSEGTLAITTKLKLNLVDLPDPEVGLVAIHCNSIEESMNATVCGMTLKPTACELMDKTILDCTKENLEQAKNRFFIEDDPEAVLLVEFKGKNRSEVEEKCTELISKLRNEELGYAYPIVIGEKTNAVWDLRKAGLGVLANIPGDRKAVACIEDTAVALEDLPSYINDFSALMKDFKQEAVYYAHAGAGELHLRPILDLKKDEDKKLFREIGEASANLVKKYNGSLSGEHGDGRVRSEFISLIYGEKIMDYFREIKTVWDPKGIFNPGKIVDALPMDVDLRYDDLKRKSPIKTKISFEQEGGILSAVEKCNGSGDCRKLNFAGGTMCPSYRATLNEKDTTRARANVLREFLSMNVKDNPFNYPEIDEVMDLCLSCKGCKSECPSNVDVASLKSEFLYHYHKTNRPNFSTRMLAKSASLNKKAMMVPGIFNSISNTNLFKGLLGIAKERSLPKLNRECFRKWFIKYDQKEYSKRVYLFCDEFTDQFDMDVGISAVKFLNAIGFTVVMPKHGYSARALISKGFLDEAQKTVQELVEFFDVELGENDVLIGLEPSAILGFRDEFPRLVTLEFRETALQLSKKVFLFEEFIFRLLENKELDVDIFTSEEKKIHLHAHCHQKALSDVNQAAEILSIPKNYKVEIIPSGCCGMAGSFGYEKEHYELSMNIGEQILFPSIRLTDEKDIIAASGTSCRHQIFDGSSRVSLHPAQILHNALNQKL